MPGTHRRSRNRKRLVAAAFASSVLAATSAGVYAALNADATGTEAVSSGTLLLTLTSDGSSGGLPVTVADMAPGDVQNVYVNLNNTGTLASAAGMTLADSATPSNALTSDATKGLAVSITQCSVAWSAGSCGGTTTSILSSTAVANVGGSGVNLSNVPSLAASTGSLAHLRFSLALPNSSETSTNGSLPSGTIQGLNTTITWTFAETQRAAQTTNS